MKKAELTHSLQESIAKMNKTATAKAKEEELTRYRKVLQNYSRVNEEEFDLLKLHPGGRAHGSIPRDQAGSDQSDKNSFGQSGSGWQRQTTSSSESNRREIRLFGRQFRAIQSQVGRFSCESKNLVFIKIG